MEKKITKVQMFAMIKAVPEVAANADMVAFIDHEVALLAKKSASKKPTKTQEANEELKATILEVLANSEPMTASEVLASNSEFEGLSNQKIASLLNALVKEEKVVKTIDKKKSYFSVPLTEDDDVVDAD